MPVYFVVKWYDVFLLPVYAWRFWQEDRKKTVEAKK